MKQRKCWDVVSIDGRRVSIFSPRGAYFGTYEVARPIITYPNTIRFPRWYDGLLRFVRQALRHAGCVVMGHNFSLWRPFIDVGSPALRGFIPVDKGPQSRSCLRCKKEEREIRAY